MSDELSISIEIDYEGLIKEVQAVLLKRLDKVVESVKEHVTKEIMFAGVGPKAWRKEVAGWYQETSRKVTDELIKINLGFRYELEEDLHPEMETQVVMFGNNSRFTRIFAGPKGREVFGWEVIEGPWIKSKVKKSYFLPQGMNFKQDGNLIIENAFRTIEAELQNAIDMAIFDIPPDIIERYMTVMM